jgi:hypothetical protein
LYLIKGTGNRADPGSGVQLYALLKALILEMRGLAPGMNFPVFIFVALLSGTFAQQTSVK